MQNWIGDASHADAYGLCLSICAVVKLFGSAEKQNNSVNVKYKM